MKKSVFSFSVFFCLALIVVFSCSFDVSAASSSGDPVLIEYPAGDYVNDIDGVGYVSFVPFDVFVLEDMIWIADGVAYINLYFDGHIYTFDASSNIVVGNMHIITSSDQIVFVSPTPFPAGFVIFGGQDSFVSGTVSLDVTFTYDESFNLYFGEVPSTFDLFYDLWVDRIPLFISLDQVGVSFDTFPDVYYSYTDVDVSSYYFTGRGDIPSLALVELLGHRVLASDFGARPFDSMTATYSVPASALVPVTPAGDSSLLSDLSDTAAAFLSTVGQIVDSIVSSPLLLVTVGIFFLGGCVALFARFLGKD